LLKTIRTCSNKQHIKYLAILKKLYVLILILMAPSVFWAKHIVGGDITYEVKSFTSSSNLYAFTMHIYRDNLSVGGAPYDNPANISIYNKQTGLIVRSINVPLNGTSSVMKPDYPCLIPPKVAVQDGVYSFETDLNIISDTYIVVYQRCCRNESISNLIDPGGIGASYTVEITGLSQQLHNNSPTFKQFPPIVICAGTPLNFDHSATDKEGDQLVYKFCLPYSGGGRTSGNDCDNNVPIPACWPPFGSVRYKEPEYSFLKPLPGDPLVIINSNTGFITGTPIEQGQFVVSVCVEEFRNGKLLSVVKRDFQFNVANCQPTVLAKVKADSVNGKTYFLNQCGDRNLVIGNLSLERASINDFRFEVNLNKPTNEVYKTWEPTIPFPDTGVYKGVLLLNPGTQCADTINLVFTIFEAIKSDFDYKYDTCVAGPVVFTDKSSSPNGKITSWKWDFGDGKSATLSNTSHLYETPGLKNATLSIEDLRRCKASKTQAFNWQPVPPILLIEPSTFVGCTPSEVTFKNLSKPIDSTYIIRWTFGDGGTSDRISPSYVYKTPGLYSVSIAVTSPIGCKISRTYKDWIKINQGSKADFTYSPDKITQFNPTISLTDQSEYATRWQWFIGNKGYSTRQNPIYTFRDTGLQKVKLLTNNQYNCLDSIIKFIDVIPEITYFLPNAFTPNNDAINDGFRGKGFTEGIKRFSLKIWNRWGELIFETQNPEESWNGRKHNVGDDSPQGVYLCIVNYFSPRGQPFEIKGYATLIR
jgi:gliding motility-associated-like protein